MSDRRGLSLALLALVTALLLVGAKPGEPAAKEGAEAQTRATMAGLFAALQELLPLSVNQMRWSHPEHSPRVRASLARLADNADVLGQHVQRADADFDFLGRNLASEAREALHRYELGEFQSAAFLVQEMTQHCVACHSRLPAEASPMASRLVEASALSALPLLEQADLHVATRRFDDALAAFERAIGSQDVHAAQLVDALPQYLITAVRVKQDPARAAKALERLAQRKDAWARLKEDIAVWRQQLTRLAPELQKTPTLKTARSIIDDARRMAEYPTDRRALVHYVVASSLLHRLRESGPKSGPQAAEVYWLLGLSEARLRQSYWVSHAEEYLERAIRLAPGTKTAREAFLVLEDEAMMAWAGTGGLHMPGGVKARLLELRKLAERGP